MVSKEKKFSLEEVKNIPFEVLEDILNDMKSYLKKDDTVKQLFKEYDVDLEIIDYIPMKFDDLNVSAKTDHGVIIFNYKLLMDGDFYKDYSYGCHEITHYLQQCFGERPTQSADDGDYLQNQFEQEGFKNQIQYIADNFNENEAEKYTEDLLDHHDKSGTERKSLKDLLMEDV